MVDIFDEVEEDLRAERAEKLLKKYAWVIIAVLVGIVGAAAGWQLWNRWQGQQAAAAAASFIGAQSAVASPAGASPQQIAILNQLATSAPQGYKTLARLTAATAKANAGDLPGAEALWTQVASDSAADPLFRDFATLMLTGRTLDSGDPAKLEARLKALAVPMNPWSALAQEQLAALDLRQGKLEDARKVLRALSIDIGAPAGARARASALLTGLGPGDTK